MRSPTIWHGITPGRTGVHQLRLNGLTKDIKLSGFLVKPLSCRASPLTSQSSGVRQVKKLSRAHCGLMGKKISVIVFVSFIHFESD